MENQEVFNSIISTLELHNDLDKNLYIVSQYKTHTVAQVINTKIYVENFKQYSISQFEISMFLQDKDKYKFAIDTVYETTEILAIAKDNTLEKLILKLIESITIAYTQLTESYRIESNLKVEKITNDITSVKENSYIISNIEILNIEDILPDNFIITLKITGINNKNLTISICRFKKYNFSHSEYILDFIRYFNLDAESRTQELLNLLEEIFISKYYIKNNYEANLKNIEIFTVFDAIKEINSNKILESKFILPLEIFEDATVFEKVTETLPYIIKKLHEIRQSKFRNDIMKNIKISQDIDDYYEGSDEILMLSFKEIDKYIKTIIDDYIKILNISINPFISELDIRNFYEKYNSDIVNIQELFHKNTDNDSLSKYKIIINFTTKQSRKLAFENNSLISENRFSKIKKRFID